LPEFDDVHSDAGSRVSVTPVTDRMGHSGMFHDCSGLFVAINGLAPLLCWGNKGGLTAVAFPEGREHWMKEFFEIFF
jgi:hypothetical protein